MKSCGDGDKKTETTTFQRALREYINSLPEKKRKRKFIVNCLRLKNESLTPEAIHESIKKAEEKSSSKWSKRIIRDVMRPIVNILKDYYGIIDTLASADPTPCALIWGAIKLVVEGADRYVTLFETIKTELHSLYSHLNRITEYEELYPDSTSLQKLLFDSYINILRFWSRIDKECERCYNNSILRLAFSFSTFKLNKIVDDIKNDADQINKLASVIDARLAKGEREDAGKERMEQAQERIEARKERQDAAQSREEQQMYRQGEIYRQILSWICPGDTNEGSQARHRRNEHERIDDTCAWISSNPDYIAWLNGNIDPPIVWLHGCPGLGKSTLCSYIIQSIQEASSKVVLAFHFYQFDRPYSALETLRLLAYQLFQKMWGSSDQAIPEDLQLIARGNSSDLDGIKKFIESLVKRHETTYLVLDGLDEEYESSRWNQAQDVIEFTIRLSGSFPKSVRVWFSSQDRPSIREKLGNFSLVDFKDQITNDVNIFLSREVLKLNEFGISQEKTTAILDTLKTRAEGNFLWASLMIKTLTNATTLGEMQQLTNDRPYNLYDHYKEIIVRLKKRLGGSQKLLASKMFSMIVFARRPLRMKEIREAIGLIQNRNPDTPDESDFPRTRSLRELFSPLIEVQKLGCEDEGDCTCRLFHSTVRDFLLKFTDAFGDGDGGPNLRITSDHIFDACLLYLSQSRFRKLLTKIDIRWVDASNQSVEPHQFLFYAAKYWDKHLCEVTETDSLRKRVLKFLLSPNFQTCIQAQSLWIDGQFKVYCVTGQPVTNTYLRRTFPRFTEKSARDDSDKLWKDYRAFIHEWRHFLHCGNCGNPRCCYLPFAGQIDRCFWRALGSRNFMSGFEGRYVSFALENVTDVGHRPSQCYEGISDSGKKIRIVRLISHDQERLEFECEYWTVFQRPSPILERTESIVTDEERTCWPLYSKYIGDEPQMRVGRADPVAFSSDCRYLRIGSQIFEEGDNGTYQALLGPSLQVHDHPSYVEEFAVRGPYVVLSSRRSVSQDSLYQSGIRDTQVDGHGSDLTRFEEMITPDPSPSFDVDDSDDLAESESESFFDDSTTDDSDEAYETWSDDSSPESDHPFEDDLITPWTGRVASLAENGNSSDSSEGNTHSESEKNEEHKSKAPESESNSSHSNLSMSAVVGFGQYRGDTTSSNEWNPIVGDNWYDIDNNDGDDYAARPILGIRSRWTRILTASLTVFDTSLAVPTRIFAFKRPLPFLIYTSPPVIHPLQSLVVWPLSSGDILFGDFKARTFFVRRLRPSTAHTRHVFMKCHFSSCGRYLHIASLEGQHMPRSSKRTRDQAPSLLHLALLVVTYRLSDHKPTRSPPRLIYRTRVNIGSVTDLSVSVMPFTLTWDINDLYFTCSDNVLQVYRIGLFKSNSETEGMQVYGLRKSIFLPDTARMREVYFFPPGFGDSDARVIIGSEKRAQFARGATRATRLINQDGEVVCATDDVFGLSGRPSPIVGCFLKESDIGGWGTSNESSEVPQDLGIGRLDRRMEQFNPDDDCDLEPYVF